MSAVKTDCFRKAMKTLVPHLKPSWNNVKSTSGAYFHEFHEMHHGGADALAESAHQYLVSEAGITVSATGAHGIVAKRFRGSPRMLKMILVGTKVAAICQRIAEKYGCVYGTLDNRRAREFATQSTLHTTPHHTTQHM